jgi:hypothetical protein
MQALLAHHVASGTLLNSGYGFPCNMQWCLRTSSYQRQPPWYASLASTTRCWRHPSSTAVAATSCNMQMGPCTFIIIISFTNGLYTPR